ncbi:MAG: hypothetical protein IJZ27_00110 [Treponema sp.]|nr:hypothetical protein [Treponema sp.]
MEIKIGADELILWLRKNNKANDVDNFVLGRKIASLMQKMEVQFDVKDEPVIWAFSNKDLLPKTSQQYMLNIEILPNIYKEISTW